MAETTSLVFITCLCLARDLVFCDDYKEIGKDITLTPSIRGKPTDIQWTHNENMVLLYDGREVVEYASFKHRVVVDFETGQLTIKKLTRQDSGQYQSEIMINGKVQTSSHTLTVLDVLPEPQVNCEPGETSDVKKLLCSVESPTQPSYEWSGLNMKVHSGPELLVEEQEENRDSVYTCTVKNQANSRSTDFTLTDCHTGRAGTAVLVPVIIIAILLLILLILLGVFLYRRKEKSRQSVLKKMDPENGEGHSLMRNYQKDVMPGSSEATLPSHARLPPQNQSIIDQKWDQANEEESSGGTNEGHKPLKETLKQSPQSDVSETDQEDTESGNKGELDKNVKNREHAVEAEENTDETEKERDKQRLEEEERENGHTEESGNEEEFPEDLNQRKTEDNQTPGEKEETKDRGHTETVSQQSAVTERNNMDSEKEAEHRHTHEKKRRSEEGERSAEQTNERMRNQRTDTEADNSEEENLDGIGRTNTDEACVRPAVDPSLDDEALGPPADSPANLEMNPMNSSDSSSNQTDPDLEEEGKRPGQEQERDQKIKEDKNHDQETQSCKQTDSDSALNNESRETDQEDTKSGNEGELDKNVKNNKHAVEAEENTDETEKERDKQRLEEEERENRQTEESGNEEEFTEHQNERKTEDNREENQTLGEKEETKDRGHTDSPANPEMSSSDSSSNQTDRDQAVRELSGSEPDAEETVVINQEEEGVL